MSALTHLSADDAAWAEAMLADWSNDECGRNLSSDYSQRRLSNSDAHHWLTGFDPEQTAANAGVPIHSPAVVDFIMRLPIPPPDPLGAKRPSP